MTDDELRNTLRQMLKDWPHVQEHARRQVGAMMLGKSTSAKKAAAVRANGQKGGRPKKTPVPPSK